MNKHSLVFVGLGKMGLPMVETFLKKGVSVYAYDNNKTRLKVAKNLGAYSIKNLNDLSNVKFKPKIYWLMLPMGSTIDEIIKKLIPILNKGDLIIDGGNASYKDSIRRRKMLKKKNIGFVGAGTSGGIKGALVGPPITFDCTIKDYKKLLPYLKILGGNYSFFEGNGKGHMAKTIHNAIEYGMMQSIAEGISLYFSHGFSEKEIKKTFQTWSKGSIIESRLVDCINEIMNKYSLLDHKQIKNSETVKIVEEILRKDCYTPILKKSMALRKSINKQDRIVNTVLARLRLLFGGHSINDKN